MNALAAIVAAANVFASQGVEETAAEPTTQSPWFWVVLLLVAVLALAWYLRAGTIRRKP